MVYNQKMRPIAKYRRKSRLWQVENNTIYSICYQYNFKSLPQANSECICLRENKKKKKKVFSTWGIERLRNKPVIL